MAITIYDVAKKAGVGIGTVSRALNNSDKILPETKARILRIAKELNYKPHALAQSLARRKTGTVAVIVPFFLTYFFVEVLKGIQKELTKHKYDLILYSVDHRKRINNFLDRTLEEKRVDGVIFCSMSMPDEYAQKFMQSPMPIVLVDSVHQQLDSIVVENEAGAYRATCQLIKSGHKKIGIINGHMASGPAKMRYKGFRRALEDNGIEVNKNFIIFSEIPDESHGFNREVGFNGMMRLLENCSELPTAIFAASDIQAIGAIQALEKQHLKVPRDMALVGFDDIEFAELFDLTTMRQPMLEMGQLGVKRLMRRINGQVNDRYFEDIEPELILRKSCGVISND